ncbi:MAG: IS110 family transposase [Candidatus Omnitrophica bacterium]|nr:IS110 family transposase [Candidatus Omnitrophota bacterium]
MKNFKYFIGIDVSKDSFVVSCKNEKFVFENRKFNMDKDGFCLADDVLKNFKKESIIGIEATGIYHFNLVDFMNRKKYNLSMVNPYKVKQFFKFVSTKPTQTDKIDSKTISNSFLIFVVLLILLHLLSSVN